VGAVRKLPAVILVVAATGVWGATFTVVKGALADTGPLTFLALRFSLAGALLLPQLRRIKGSPALLWAAACGVSLFVGYTFQTSGLLTTTPARSAFITSLSAVLVPLAEPIAGLAAFSWRVLGGALVALGGLAVLLRPGSTEVTVGDLLTLGCALAFAAHTMLLNRAVKSERPELVNAVQVATVALLAVPSAGIEGWRFVASPRLGMAVGITALLATVGAFWAMAAAQRHLSAAETGVILVLEPVAAAAVSLLLGEDRLSGSLLLGGSLVLAGVVLATLSARGSAPPAGFH
jgi:drug/metabolite transporter (DMT)-like permease